MSFEFEPSSFRDPAGFVFNKDKKIFRYINIAYKKHYDHFMGSGLYKALVSDQLLIPHHEVDAKEFNFSGLNEFGQRPYSNLKWENCYLVLAVDRIPFISYPYEWAFSQLKAAALLTLKIQSLALEHGMTLKDASAYNIQFIGSRAIFIDVLSFELIEKEQPWIAYRQYCQHFLCPLALISYQGFEFSLISRLFIDGVPLGFASRNLPARTYLDFGLFTHIHLHAKLTGRSDDAKSEVENSRGKFKGQAFKEMVLHLIETTKKMTLNTKNTEWSEYYDTCSYNLKSQEHKKSIVKNYIGQVCPKTVVDVGANTGTYSRICNELGAQVIAVDIDPLAVDRLYQNLTPDCPGILPLVMDLSNQSPAWGWGLNERRSFQERCKSIDLVLALALVHHLRFKYQIPLGKIAEQFAQIGNYLIVEFVSPEDDMVQKLMRQTNFVFTDYTQESFETSFSVYFDIKSKSDVIEMNRVLYLLKRK